MSARVTLELEMRDLKMVRPFDSFYTHDEPASGKDVPALVTALDKYPRA